MRISTDRMDYSARNRLSSLARSAFRRERFADDRIRHT
jgi:hypothetical protein